MLSFQPHSTQFVPNYFDNYFDNAQGTNLDMNNYINVLTPPTESSDSSMFSPKGECLSPPQYIQYVQPPFERLPSHKPYLTVLEEPVDRFRFRYKSEMSGTHGSLNGKSSDRARKQTYPTVKIHNVNVPLIIRCSLYQWGREEMAHRRQPHAHRLVRKHDGTEMDDPHSLRVSSDNDYTANFHSMGIIHTAKKYIVPELYKKYINLKREEIARVEGKDRALTKKEEIDIREMAEKESKCINLNIVCLRFEAFEVRNNIYYPVGQPIYSNAINNLKSALTGDLKIVRMDHCTSPCNGGREIFILVEKVTKKNIKVRFYELDDDDNEIWSDYGRFTDLDVHHQYAIVFKTPPYRNQNIDSQVRVYIELERPSDSARSDPKDFTYTPSETMYGGRKRLRYTTSSYNSSSFSSSDLPATINSVTTSSNQYQVNGINSDELNAALGKGDFNSREFDKLCSNLFSSGPIESLYPDDEIGLAMDGSAHDTERDIKPHQQNCIVLRVLTPAEIEMLETVKRVLTTFLKTAPNEERIVALVNEFFENKQYITSENNTILHLLVIENSVGNSFLKSIIQVLKTHKKSMYLNIQNDEGKTALHLAVEIQNEGVVAHLINAGANGNVFDNKGNTSLHLAVHNLRCLSIKALLNRHCNPNLYNFEGLTPLHLAVKSNNMPLCVTLKDHGANVNLIDKKNGFTPLHMAVQNGNLEIVQFLISTGEVNLFEDYGECSALRLAKVMIKGDQPHTLQIFNILESFMKNKGIFEEVEIKEEIEEDEEEEDMMDIESNPVKMEPMSPGLIRSKFEDVKCFTEETMAEVSEILDKSGTWENLADLLDHGYLLKSSDFLTATNAPSRSLLNFALASGDTVLQIRDFLENLDETRAVQLIDDMVKNQF